MKIYSKFQDYYDSALGSFVDSDVVYNRKQETAVFPLSTIPNLGKEFFPKYSDYEVLDHRGNPEENVVILVGFCGKYYYGLHYDYFSQYAGHEEYFDYAKSAHKYITFEQFKNYRTAPWKNIPVKFQSKYARFLDLKDPEKTDWWKDEAFEKYGPVFSVFYPLTTIYCFSSNDVHIVKNPCLKDLGFIQVMDPFTCLYNINEWIDSHARPDDAIVPVGDDITRLKAYGFDEKTSFRKAKEKK